MSSPITQAAFDCEPEFVKIKDATRIFAVSRSEIYRLAPSRPDLLVKWGRATLVRVQVLRNIMAALPAASIRPAPTAQPVT